MVPCHIFAELAEQELRCVEHVLTLTATLVAQSTHVSQVASCVLSVEYMRFS